MRYDRVDQAIAEGKLWRAKEILEGRLWAPDFDLELLRRYGKVLLAMGDLIAAGRVLYFAGSRDTEDAEAIALFLSRHQRDPFHRFCSSMPQMVRRQPHLAAYLASDEFAASGWSASALQSIKPPMRRPRSAPVLQKHISSWRQAFEIAVIILMITFVVISFMGGLRLIADAINWLFS